MKNKLNIPILTEKDDDYYNFNYIDHYKYNWIRKFYKRFINHNKFGLVLIKTKK